MESVIEKNEKIVQVKNSYYLLSYDDLKYFISMNPYGHLESEQEIIEKKTFLIDNKQCLCEHCGLYPIIARKEKYNPVNA